jgi:hypothetical protein
MPHLTPYVARLAVSANARHRHFGARFRSFSGSTCFNGGARLIPIEQDDLDTAPETVLINTHLGDEVVGAARLLLPCPAMARHLDLEVGLPLARDYDLRPLLREGSLGEPGRVCVVPEHRGTTAAPVTIDAVFCESRRRGVDLLVAGASTETDCLEDARIQLAALAARGLVSDRYRLPRKAATAPGRASRPFYGPEQRRRAAQGNLAGLPVAGTLSLYARWGARFVGEPVLDPVFGLFSLPIAVRVADAPSLWTVLSPLWRVA